MGSPTEIARALLWPVVAAWGGIADYLLVKLAHEGNPQDRWTTDGHSLDRDEQHVERVRRIIKENEEVLRRLS